MIAVRIDNCGDFYFHLTAPVVGTSFGKSLNELVHMKHPGIIIVRSIKNSNTE